MRLVVDTNVLITFFWKSSVFENVTQTQKCQLYAPEYALEEIKMHEDEITKKVGMSKENFQERLQGLKEKITFISLERYAAALKEVMIMVQNLPPNKQNELLQDADFLALAHNLKCPLWSNDSLLKKQGYVNVFTTKEIIELLSDLL